MSLVLDVKARIEATVAALAGRVQEVADLSELIARNALPQREVAAFVVPVGFNGGAPDAATGFFRQPLEQVVGVVLVVKAPGDAKAQRALATVDSLEEALLAQIPGWAPQGAIGVFRALRGRLIGVPAGTVFYQLDFAIQNQLRNAA
jgi:hypothetical protein